MTTRSTTAQAIYQAWAIYTDPYYAVVEVQGLADAIKELAYQLFPEECPPYEACLHWLHNHPNDPPPWQVRSGKRAEILKIAEELDAGL